MGSVLLAIATAVLPIFAAMQSAVSAQRLLNCREAAEFLHRSCNGVYILAREGRIPHYRVGASLRFDLAELRAWLQENRHGPAVNGE